MDNKNVEPSGLAAEAVDSIEEVAGKYPSY